MKISRLLALATFSALLVVFSSGCAGKALHEACRVGGSLTPTGDDCGDGLACEISEHCQESSTSCQGVCRTKCDPYGSNPIACGANEICDCSSYNGCYCLTDCTADAAACNASETCVSSGETSACWSTSNL